MQWNFFKAKQKILFLIQSKKKERVYFHNLRINCLKAKIYVRTDRKKEREGTALK